MKPSKRSPISTTLQSVVATTPRHARAWDEARARRRELAPFAAAGDAIAALRGGKLDVHVQNALVTAMVEEHQRAPHPLWPAVLLGAFEPMLTWLRARVDRKKDEDRDQQVLLAFLEAIAEVRAGAYTLLAIRWVTEARVFGAVREERRAPKRVSYDDARPPRGVSAASAFEKVAAAEIMHMIETRGGAELLGAVVATEANDEALVDYVARAYADRTPKERASAYARLKVARGKVMDDLRARLARRAA